MAQGGYDNAIISNEVEEFSAGAGRLPVKNYGGNPMEFGEFLMNYKQMVNASGYSAAKAVQRLPIYLTGMARSVYMNMATKKT